MMAETDGITITSMYYGPRDMLAEDEITSDAMDTYAAMRSAIRDARSLLERRFVAPQDEQLRLELETKIVAVGKANAAWAASFRRGKP